jgi:hypothetical protein
VAAVCHAVGVERRRRAPTCGWRGSSTRTAIRGWRRSCSSVRRPCGRPCWCIDDRCSGFSALNKSSPREWSGFTACARGLRLGTISDDAPPGPPSQPVSLPEPAALGPHVIRLRPCDHVKVGVERYQLTIGGEHQLHWQRDPHGNHLARLTFKVGARFSPLDVHRRAHRRRARGEPVRLPGRSAVQARAVRVPRRPGRRAGAVPPSDDPALALGPRRRVPERAAERRRRGRLVVAINRRSPSGCATSCARRPGCGRPRRR